MIAHFKLFGTSGSYMIQIARVICIFVKDLQSNFIDIYQVVVELEHI